MPIREVGLQTKEGRQRILMAAGDTFGAAASDQLEVWTETTGCEIVVAEQENAKVSVIDELGIPVKFIGVGEGVEDPQTFDAEAFVEMPYFHEQYD